MHTVHQEPRPGRRGGRVAHVAGRRSWPPPHPPATWGAETFPIANGGARGSGRKLHGKGRAPTGRAPRRGVGAPVRGGTRAEKGCGGRGWGRHRPEKAERAGRGRGACRGGRAVSGRGRSFTAHRGVLREGDWEPCRRGRGLAGRGGLAAPRVGKARSGQEGTRRGAAPPTRAPPPATASGLRRGGGRAGRGAWPRRPEGASSGRGGPWPPPRAPVRQGASGGAGRAERGRRRRAPASSSSSSASRTQAAAAGRTGTAPAASAPSALSAPHALARYVGGCGVRGLLRRQRAHGHLLGRRGAPRAAGPRGRGPCRRPGNARAAPRGLPAWATGAASATSWGRPRRRRRTPPAGCQHPGRPARRARRCPGGRLTRLLLIGRFVPVLRPRLRRRARGRQEPSLSLPGLRQSVLQVLAPQIAPANAHR